MKTRRSKDRRDHPAYLVSEAASYLAIPRATLDSWLRERGRQPAVLGGVARVHKRLVLSFYDLTEAHVLASIRREHGVAMQNVRRALKYVASELAVQRPLLEQQFETDGMDLFVEKWGRLVNVSQAGQLAVRHLLEESLKRIDRDPKGLPIRLYPRVFSEVESRAIVIDPARGFGRPILRSKGIPVAEIAHRLIAGEPANDVMEDFDITADDVVLSLKLAGYDAAALG
jgi:uncharacterized protein (DUF433 family)